MRAERPIIAPFDRSSGQGSAARWLLRCLERFPIPIEEIACVQAFSDPDAAQSVWSQLARRTTGFDDD